MKNKELNDKIKIMSEAKNGRSGDELLNAID